MKMAEVKTYEKEGRTYTVYGGARDTTYDNFAQAVRRMRNLAKKGLMLVEGWYDMTLDRFVFCMNVPLKLDRYIHTPGFQYAQYLTSHGRSFVRMNMTYARNPAMNCCRLA